MKKLFLFATVIAVFSSCGSAGDSDEFIIYEELPELDVTLITEAGEGGGYFPGRISGLFISSNGDLLVSDMGSNTVEQFSPDGEYLGTVAQRGSGPGEVSGFFQIYDAGGDTLMVESQGGRRDLFYPGDDGTYRYTRNMAGESGSMEGFVLSSVRSDTEFYATRRRIVRNPIQMMSNPNDYHDTYIHVVNRNNEAVADSIHRLRTPEWHMLSIGNGFSIHEVPFRNHDRFVPTPIGGYMVARPADSQLLFFDDKHEHQSTLTLNIAERKIGRADLDHALKNASSDMRRAIEPRVYDTKPPFLNIWASEEWIWLQSDNSEEGKQIIVMDYDGNFHGRFLISEFDEVQKVRGNRIYTIHRNPDLGDSARIYEADV